jgi:hypothetical protein
VAAVYIGIFSVRSAVGHRKSTSIFLYVPGHTVTDTECNMARAKYSLSHVTFIYRMLSEFTDGSYETCVYIAIRLNSGNSVQSRWILFALIQVAYRSLILIQG